MSTPSNRTRIRSAINLVSKDTESSEAIGLVIDEIVRISSPELLVLVASGGLMGATEVAQTLGINNATNIWKVPGLPQPFARINGGRRDPVWLAVTIYAFAEERARRKAA